MEPLVVVYGCPVEQSSHIDAAGDRIVHDVEKFRDVLLEKGWKLDQGLHYERVEGAEHNEAAWARRVGPVLQFLYPAR